MIQLRRHFELLVIFPDLFFVRFSRLAELGWVEGPTNRVASVWYSEISAFCAEISA